MVKVVVSIKPYRHLPLTAGLFAMSSRSTPKAIRYARKYTSRTRGANRRFRFNALEREDEKRSYRSIWGIESVNQTRFREVVNLLRPNPAINNNQLPKVAIRWPILLSPVASRGRLNLRRHALLCNESAGTRRLF